MSEAKLSPATLVVKAGRPSPGVDAPANPPIVLASAYGAGGMEYGRYENPTWAAFESALGALEGGQALVFSSGSAAVATVLDLLSPGAVVVAPRHAYHGTLHQLADLTRTGRVGEVRLVDIADTAAVVAALDGAQLLWAESPTNPALEVADLPALCAAARSVSAMAVVDNTFATPLLQRPFSFGADVVVHSGSKYLAGHSDVIIGAVVVRSDSLYSELLARRKSIGAVAGPFETYLTLRGLRTLALRLERSCANALELATRLESHPGVERVRYPGLPSDPGHERAKAQMSGAFGGIIAAEIRGGGEAADRLVKSTSVWLHATSLGGLESTMERRRRWAGESPTIPEGLVRLNVGIEDVEDLWTDLDQALRT
jgi:cystathionine gamma-synthase